MTDKKPPRVLWTRDQLLVAFMVYLRLPFGQLSQGNKKIVAVARAIGRTPSALALKTVNFASLDPAHQLRGIKGMSNTSEVDRAMWNEFVENSEAFATQCEAAWEAIVPSLLLPVESRPDELHAAGSTASAASEPARSESTITPPAGPTEIERNIRTRRVQSFFRAAVLTSYDNRCALTGLAVPELLTASHIISWSENIERRADPCNGIALNALHDRAFDRGLITFDDDFRVVVSPHLATAEIGECHEHALRGIAGQVLKLPHRFHPDRRALAWHRDCIFRW
jgi:hypothetical protein